MTTYEQRVSAFKNRHGIGRRQMKPVFKRGYEAAAHNRLTADLSALSTRTADSEIQYDIVSLRNRARHLARESDYVARFLNALTNNVLKDDVGFSLQMKAMRPPTFEQLDKVANAKIEEAWREWSKKANCTVTGEDSFYDVTRLAVRQVPTDGGILFRKVVDQNINKFGFALQLMEVDMIDVNKTEAQQTPGGNRITMGVEKNAYGKTTHFHILDRHPGDLLFGGQRGRWGTTRYNASEFIHYFVKERVTQCMGVPWIAPSMLRLQHLKEYELAELVAAREAAVKGGYFTSDRGDSYKGEDELSVGADGTTQTSGTYNDFETGQKDVLPPGMTFTPYDPQHPMQQYGDFVKNALFGISAGLNISYATLTGDLSMANYSSMRAGKIEEQEGYKKIQCHMIQHLCMDIFEEWLRTSLLNGAINLPLSKFDIFNKPKFTGRRWPWVDPEKDIRAALMEIDGGLSTRTRWTEESGEDYEEICRTQKDEKAIAKENGLSFAGANGKTEEKQTEKEKPDSEDKDTVEKDS